MDYSISSKDRFSNWRMPVSNMENKKQVSFKKATDAFSRSPKIESIETSSVDKKNLYQMICDIYPLLSPVQAAKIIIATSKPNKNADKAVKKLDYAA